MKIIFQENKFNIEKEISRFSAKNTSVGSIISFIGKVREINHDKKLIELEISCYKKMASFQTKKIVRNLLKLTKLKTT